VSQEDVGDVQAERLERMNRFVRRMNEVERDLSSPYVRPKDAATLILVDRSGPVPKVLLGKRHQRHKFMPGRYVFPGGRVDPVDKLMPVAHALDPQAEAHLLMRLQRPSAVKARAFALAAIRETFEETGLILGVRSSDIANVPNGPKIPSKIPSGPWSSFAAAGILPDLSMLRFIGRAITPPGRSRRFDARFFTADANAIAHRIEGVTGPDAELTELVWMSLAEAKQLDMPAVTGVMMEELDARIADGFGHDLPVPFYSMPRGRFRRELL
jgi:8-oxo-dGTP pyrophosphatase MutT (NUDIX family)